MMVDLVYLAFVLCAPALFLRVRPDTAVLAIFLGGWVVLPVGHYPAGSASAVFPYWITGLAVPSDMLLTKAWIAPAAALLGAVVFDRRRLFDFRPAWIDAPIALWCLWPLLAAPFAASANPPAWIASAYLAGAWGIPWLLGRLYFSTGAGPSNLAWGLVWSALACLPIALIEGLGGPSIYSAVYETHPFRADGAVRYLGFRPLGFFEDGNQYGLWICLAALAAIWLAVTHAEAGRPARLARGAAALVTAMALAAQSAGALMLLLLGASFLSVCRWVRPRGLALGALGAIVIVGAVYLSGRVPVTHWAKDTAVGRQLVDGLRGIGRGSLGWRIAQDQKLLPDAMAHPLAGTADWEWWRAHEVRPWGLSVLVLGQFGLPGMCFCLASFLLPSLRLALRMPRGSGWSPGALPLMLATLCAMSAIDALMNSFIFFPAVMIAGAIANATPPSRRRGEITRIARRSTA